jgi:DNA-binding response OmpR family regulator
MRKKVLVVDDDAELVELVCFNLKQAGYATGTAFSGGEALRKACSILPDLIVLDLMLPEMDGFAVCEVLRRDATTAEIPIIMLTALSSELGRLAGLDCGADEYITKPFSPKNLISQVESLLRRGPVRHRTWPDRQARIPAPES